MKPNFELFYRLCQERGTTVNRVAKEVGVQSATVSAWKLGQYNPKIDKVSKIADYFGIEVSEFYKEDKDVRAIS